MIFEYKLKNEYLLPIFNNKIGEHDNNNNMSVEICVDTGASITTFYKPMDVVKDLYPDIHPLNVMIPVMDVNGNSCQYPLFKINQFKLIDNNNQLLIIRNLVCIISEIKMDITDILLSGTIFYNTALTITPYREDNEIGRLLRIDTFEEDRDTLIMNDEKMGPYYAWLSGKIPVSQQILEANYINQKIKDKK